MEQQFDINVYTNRQLVEGCMERLYIVIKKAIQTYINSLIENTNDPSRIDELQKTSNKDLLGMLTFFIHNHDSIVAFFNLGDSRLIRSRLFELKQARNDYAHNREYSQTRDVVRVYDTSLYLFDDIGLDPNFETYKLFKHIRGLLVIREAKEIYAQEQQNQQQQQQQQQQFNNRSNQSRQFNNNSNNNYQNNQQSQYFDSNDYGNNHNNNNNNNRNYNNNNDYY